MILLKKDGKKYEITEADQERIRDLAIHNGGNLQAAAVQCFQEKYGFDPRVKNVEGVEQNG